MADMKSERERVSRVEFRAQELVDHNTSWQVEMSHLSIEEIWQDQELPEKIRRLLIVDQLFETNERFYVPGEWVFNDLPMVTKALEIKGFFEAQASTSTSFDFALTQSPIVKISEDESVEEGKAKLAKVVEEYERVYESQIVSRFGYVVPKEEMEKFLVSDSWFVFYKNHWSEDNKDKIVGGRFSIESRLNKPRSENDAITIEAGLGVMGRSVGVESPGYSSDVLGRVRKGIDVYGQLRSEKIEGYTGESRRDKLADKEKERVRNEGMCQVIGKLTKDPDFRIKLRALQRLNDEQAILVDWAWDDQERKLMIFDYYSVNGIGEDQAKVDKVRRELVRLPFKGISQAMGPHLEQLYRGLRYDHHRDKDKEPYEVFVKKMGPDVVFLTHPDERAKRMRLMIDDHRERGVKISLEDERLLITACYVHDLGELMVGKLGVGDVAGYSKTEADQDVERVVFYAIMEGVSEGSEKELMVKAYEEVERDRDSRLGKVFAVVEYIRYLENAIKAIEGEKEDRPVRWNKICGSIVGRPLQWLMDRMDKHPYIKVFLMEQENKQAIDKIFEEVDENQVVIVDEARGFKRDYMEYIREAKRRWEVLRVE